MKTAIFQGSFVTRRGAPAGVGVIVAVTLAVWFVSVVSLGIAGAFVGRPGTPPLPLAIGFAAPLALFFISLRLSPRFVEFVHSLDLRLIVGVQAWRWAGLGFIALYAHGILPAVFALPAGVGDMAVGFCAPWMALALMRQSDFAASRTFVRWNILGILDLVIALSIGTVSALSPMATLPLLLIPAFLVPLFLMLHSVALIQGRAAGDAK